MEPVVVGNVADTRVLDRVVDALHGGEDGVDGDDADGVLRLLVLVRRYIAASALDGHLDLELARRIQRCDVKIRIQDLDVAAAFDVGCCDLTLPNRVNANGVRLRTLHRNAELLEREHDARHIIPYAGNGGELVKDAVDLDGGNRCSIQ